MPPAEGLSHALKRSLIRFTLLISAITVCLFIGELAIRVILPIVATPTDDAPALVWDKSFYDELGQRGSQSFRSYHLDTQKPEDSNRIVVLGDSFSWGDKIAQTSDVWPQVLEQLFRKDGQATQVINLALNGLTTVNQLEVLEKHGWDYEPNTIILQYFLNDPLPSGPNLQAADEGVFLFGVHPLIPRYHYFLSKHSALYRFLNEKSVQLQSRYFLKDKSYKDLFRENFEGWKESKTALRAIAEQARARNVRFLIVLFPVILPKDVGRGGLDEGTYYYLSEHKKIALAASDAGAEFLDLRPIYAAINEDGAHWRSPYDGHPNERGHRQAASAIRNMLR